MRMGVIVIYECKEDFDGTDTKVTKLATSEKGSCVEMYSAYACYEAATFDIMLLLEGYNKIIAFSGTHSIDCNCVNHSSSV
uniref:Dirigent protein n=1 Tax=Syphacia muris TaxID=451379 RepID=A0A0N5AFH0_9BILA